MESGDLYFRSAVAKEQYKPSWFSLEHLCHKLSYKILLTTHTYRVLCLLCNCSARTVFRNNYMAVKVEKSLQCLMMSQPPEGAKAGFLVQALGKGKQRYSLCFGFQKSQVQPLATAVEKFLGSRTQKVLKSNAQGRSTNKYF